MKRSEIRERHDAVNMSRITLRSMRAAAKCSRPGAQQAKKLIPLALRRLILPLAAPA